jgi:hypothetical protein
VTDTAQPTTPAPPRDPRRLSKLAVAALSLAVLSVSASVVYGWLHIFVADDITSCVSTNRSEEVAGAVCMLSAMVTTVFAVAAVLVIIVNRRTIWGKRLCATAVLLAFAGVFVGSEISRLHPRPKQAEARSKLKAAFTALKASRGANGKYAETLAEVRFVREETRRYALFYRDDVIQPDRPGFGPYTREQFPPILKKLLDECKDLAFSKSGFVVFVVGNIDCDPELDVWAMNDKNMLIPVFDDLDDEEWSGWVSMSDFCRKTEP